jgi:hypothetical protein
MDKVTLSKEQLKVLVRFIHSRGFREPSVVMDILDHFACKVEEKIIAQPDISLEDAMHDAHRDFGVSGFRNLAKAHQAQFDSRHRRIFKKNALDLLKSVPFVLGVVLAAVGYYRGYIWAQEQDISLLWGTNVFTLGVWLAFTIGVAKIHGGVPKKYLKTNAASGYTTNVWAWIAYGLFYTSVQFFPGLSGAPQMPAAYCTFVFVYLVVYYIAEYRTINKLFENYKDVEHMLLELE